MSRHLSVRMGERVFEQLEAQSRRSGQSRSAVAKQLLEEGLRMEQHPGIVFRSGPGGRRAGLIGGPDVWEVVCALAEDERGLEGIGEWTGLTADHVGAALRYYAEYADEVDDWIQRIEEEAERADAVLKLREELSGKLRASLEAVASGSQTRSAEKVAKRQGLSW